MEQVAICSLTQGGDGCLLYVDGASRGNPGPAAVGAVIKARLSNEMFSVVWRAGRSIGKKTNNEAEYEALLFGLERVLKSEYKHVVAMSDSEVLVRQFKGQYRVENPDLRSLLQRVGEIARKLNSFSLRHIPRSDNTEADGEANEALDKGMPSGRLQEDSACPVCLDLFEPPVFQCPKGHLICRECLDNLLQKSDNETCPECRTPYQGLRIPNVVADDFIKQWRGQQTSERPLSTYELSKKFTFDLRHGPKLDSAKVGSLSGGSYVDIIELKVISESDRIRGRTPMNQWLTIKRTNPVEVLASPLPLGTYRVEKFAELSIALKMRSQKGGELLAGDYVDIVETRVLPDDNRVRAKVANGKWMSLVDTSFPVHTKWAVPLPLGTYKLKRLAALGSGVNKVSQTIGELQTGDYVDIIETRVVPEDQRVRAKIASGQWMSLVDTTDGKQWAKSLPLGSYKVTSFVNLQNGIMKSSKVICSLQAGEKVDIIETRVVPEDKRVRAKLTLGLWISLVNTENGSVWAKPWDVAEAEERHRGEVQGCTCSQCNRVFVHSRARDQHYNDSHQLSCQGFIQQSNYCMNHSQVRSWKHLKLTCIANNFEVIRVVKINFC